MSEQVFNFATIGAVYEDGVTLIFDGQAEAGQKHYKCNTSAAFAAGDRVKILADSGTYVVEYVVGAPKTSGGGVDAATLGGETADKLSVAYAADAGKLGGKAVGELSVASAAAVADNATASQLIYLKCVSGVFYIKVGQYGTWKKITVT